MKATYIRSEQRRWAFTEAELLSLLRAEITRAAGVALPTEKPLAEAWTLEFVKGLDNLMTVTVIHRFDYPKPTSPRDLAAAPGVERITSGPKAII